MAAVPSKKPADTAFKQQRLPACRPIFTPLAVGIVFLLIGIPFVIVGRSVSSLSAQISEMSMQYDGSGANVDGCQINKAGAGTNCVVTFTPTEDMPQPVFVYYELSNFYQNHRRYVKSYDRLQLLGCTSTSDSGCGSLSPSKNCDPLVNNGTLLLNPCGLIAASMFNDMILLTTGQTIDYQSIAWPTDASKYLQPNGFKFQADGNGLTPASDCYNIEKGKCTALQCNSLGSENNNHAGCQAWKCPDDAPKASYYGCESKAYYLYYYPDNANVQYLYESFPEVVSPIKGLLTPRFQVWMRAAALPKFRKLYAVINTDLKKGMPVKFSVQANFDVSRFEGTKSIVLTTTTWFGGKNDFLGTCFTVVGSICLAFGVIFIIKQFASPRVLGDLKYLQ